MRYILTIVWGLLILSCTYDNDLTDRQEPDMLNFRIDEVATRGVVFDENNLDSFGVFCYYTGDTEWDASPLASGAYMDNVKVYRAGTADNWEYANPKPWGGPGYHTFFAYAPYTTDQVKPKTTTPGALELEFTLTTPITSGGSIGDAINHIDLLYSKNIPTDIKQHYLSSKDSRVPIHFAHALTKVSFEARLDYTPALDTTVQVNAIYFTDLYCQSTLKMTKNGANGVTEATWYYDPTSSIASDKRRDIYALSPGAITPVNLVKSTNYSPITTLNGFMMLIPQSIENRLDGSTPLLVIDYAVTTTGPGGNTQIKKVGYELAKIIKEFEIGQSVKFQLTYDGTGLAAMSATCVVGDWDDQDVDGDLEGTYLQVSSLNVSFSQTSSYTIYYFTDFPGIVECILPPNGLTALSQPGCFKLSGTKGTYTATLKAGKLSRTIRITITD